MTIKVLKFNPKERSTKRMVCSGCGVAAACNCGKPYISAGEYAAKAVAENPQKSDRAIAAEIGVSQPTVLRARKKLTDTNVSVEKRQGRDGKVRRLPSRRNLELVMPTEAEAEAEHQKTLYELACRHLRDMTNQTRQKFFAYIRRKYHD